MDIVFVFLSDVFGFFYTAFCLFKQTVSRLRCPLIGGERWAKNTLNKWRPSAKPNWSCHQKPVAETTSPFPPGSFSIPPSRHVYYKALCLIKTHCPANWKEGTSWSCFTNRNNPCSLCLNWGNKKVLENIHQRHIHVHHWRGIGFRNAQKEHQMFQSRVIQATGETKTLRHKYIRFSPITDYMFPENTFIGIRPGFFKHTFFLPFIVTSQKVDAVCFFSITSRCILIGQTCYTSPKDSKEWGNTEINKEMPAKTLTPIWIRAILRNGKFHLSFLSHYCGDLKLLSNVFMLLAFGYQQHH